MVIIAHLKRMTNSNFVGNSPKRPLETDGEGIDNRPWKKQKLSEDNVNIMPHQGVDEESEFEPTVASNDLINLGVVGDANTNKFNEGEDKDVDEEGLESLEEMNLSPALFGDSDDEQNNNAPTSENNSDVFEIKDDELIVTSHKNSAGTIDLRRAHPNDDDDFAVKREKHVSIEENQQNIFGDQEELGGEKEHVGDLILSPEGEDPVVKVVAAINRKLRPYQREGVKFL